MLVIKETKQTPLSNQFLNKHNSYQLYFRMFLSEGVPILYALLSDGFNIC